MSTPVARHADGGIRLRLNQALRTALSARDMASVAALRSALSAIANAEAVDPGPARVVPASNPHIAGTVAGLGATEAKRRVLSEDEIAAIVRAEIAERRAAAEVYDQGGHPDRADRLRREAATLTAQLSSRPPPL